VNGNHSAWLFFVLLAAGCPQSATPTATPAQPATLAQAPAPATVNAAQSAAPTDSEPPCTLQTALTPGIPGSPGHPIPSTINPNGNSELAQLMRTMQADLKLAREAIEKGEKVGPLWPRFRKIRCSWPTNQADRNAAFDTAAQSYLSAVQALEAPPASEAKPPTEGCLMAAAPVTSRAVVVQFPRSRRCAFPAEGNGEASLAASRPPSRIRVI
jgi:hypothetical protein